MRNTTKALCIYKLVETLLCETTSERTIEACAIKIDDPKTPRSIIANITSIKVKPLWFLEFMKATHLA